MKLTPAIQKYIQQSILCWLATSSTDGMPNVSPKEVFIDYEDEYIIIANIASPNTVKNIKMNPQVCISFIDVFIQKGYQLKGKAVVVDKKTADYPLMEKKLLELTGGKFPFSSITKITIEQAKPIIAPKYLLYPETTEDEQVASAKKSYGI